MSLKTTLDQINALLTAQTIGGQSVTAFIGPENVHAHAAPPRVVWVPSRDKYGPPRMIGGNPRHLRTRKAGVEVHCWGTDYDATELLVNMAQAAIHQIAVGSYQLEGEAGWLALQGGLQNLGRGYVFTVAFDLFVPESTLPTGPVTSIPQTNTIALGNPPVDEDAG